MNAFLGYGRWGAHCALFRGAFSWEPRDAGASRHVSCTSGLPNRQAGLQRRSDIPWSWASVTFIGPGLYYGV